MTQSDLFQIDNEIPWQPAGNGVTRQVYGYDDKLMLIKVKFEKGSVGTPHRHPHSQITYVASGSFKTTIGHTVKVVNAGDGFTIPAQELHGVECLEAGMLIDAFSPAREDFL